MMAQKVWWTQTVSLQDRFGDNGLISVVLAQIVDASLSIDTWLMSCRVLKRGVEQFLMNRLCETVSETGSAIPPRRVHPDREKWIGARPLHESRIHVARR